MIVDRILKIIELKKISKNKFYKETGLSNGFLDKVKDVGTSKIENILTTYPDVNPIWLITGKGEPFKTEEQLNEFQNNSAILKNHIIWELLESYENNISDIQYFYDKTNIIYVILTNLREDTNSNLKMMIGLIKSNIESTKEAYFLFFATLGLRQELVTNSSLIDNEKLKEFLKDKPYDQLENECRKFIEMINDLNKRVRNVFEGALNILLKYSEIK